MQFSHCTRSVHNLWIICSIWANNLDHSSASKQLISFHVLNITLFEYRMVVLQCWLTTYRSKYSWNIWRNWPFHQQHKKWNFSLLVQSVPLNETRSSFRHFKISDHKFKIYIYLIERKERFFVELKINFSTIRSHKCICFDLSNVTKRAV